MAEDGKRKSRDNANNSMNLTVDNLTVLIQKITEPVTAMMEKLIDKMENKFQKILDVAEGRLYCLQEKYDKLQEETNKLTKQNELQASQIRTNKRDIIQLQEKLLESNIIITGYNENELGDPDEAINKVLGKLGIGNIGIKNRFFYKRPIKTKSGNKYALNVELIKKEEKYRIFKECNKLKGSEIFINSCHIPVINEAITRLKKKAWEMKAIGKNAYVKNECLYVGNAMMKDAVQEVIDLFE